MTPTDTHPRNVAIVLIMCALVLLTSLIAIITHETFFIGWASGALYGIVVVVYCTDLHPLRALGDGITAAIDSIMRRTS